VFIANYLYCFCTGTVLVLKVQLNFWSLKLNSVYFNVTIRINMTCLWWVFCWLSQGGFLKVDLPPKPHFWISTRVFEPCLLLCCIYTDGQLPEKMLSYMEHGSLAYGVDWCRSSVNELPELPAEYDSVAGDNTLPGSDGLNCEKLADETFGRTMHSRSLCTVSKNDELIASCSFDDHQLRIWAILGTAAAR